MVSKWVWLKIKQQGQTAGFGPRVHLPGQAILEFRFFEPQPSGANGFGPFGPSLSCSVAPILFPTFVLVAAPLKWSKPKKGFQFFFSRVTEQLRSTVFWAVGPWGRRFVISSLARAPLPHPGHNPRPKPRVSG